MKRNKVYYAIFTRDGMRQYHVSRDRVLVERGESMSRRASVNHPAVKELEQQWRNEAKFLELIKVEVKDG